ncbi:MAG: hypothetical protein E7596_05980 [Ruminococcaceae bacterium]|nr:hypothetical protein [Oscillospiraceae bacterium]
MKKFLSLFLVTIMISALLMSCTSPQGIGSSSTNSTEQSDTGDKNSSTDSSNLPSAPTTSSSNKEDTSSSDSSNSSDDTSSNPSDNGDNNDGPTSQPAEPNKSMMHVTVNGQNAYGYYFPYNGREFAIEHDSLYDRIFPYAYVSNETEFEIAIDLDIPMSKAITESFIKANFFSVIHNKGSATDINDYLLSLEYDESTGKAIKIKIEIDKPITDDYLMLLFVPLRFHNGYGGTIHIGIKGEAQKAEPSDINTSRLPVTYAYGCSWSDDIPYAVLLFDDSYLSGGFGTINVPEDITAGDILNIVHTGYILTQETYPGSSFLIDGEVLSYSFTYADVIHLEGEDFSIERIKNDYLHRNYMPYVILDRSGRYISLDQYIGDEIYLVVDTEKSNKDGKIPVACLLAYNPRDLEDGVPQYENISENEAIKIAHDHYYYTYFVKYAEIFEYETSCRERLDGYWEIRITEYWKGRTYYYTIDKITGEIVSMAIDE